MIHEQGFSSAFMLKMHVLNLWTESLYEKKKNEKKCDKTRDNNSNLSLFDIIDFFFIYTDYLRNISIGI